MLEIRGNLRALASVALSVVIVIPFEPLQYAIAYVFGNDTAFSASPQRSEMAIRGIILKSPIAS